MTAKEAVADLKAMKGDRDLEIVHCKADDLLCNVILELARGHRDVIALKACAREFKAFDKWYG